MQIYNYFAILFVMQSEISNTNIFDPVRTNTPELTQYISKAVCGKSKYVIDYKIISNGRSYINSITLNSNRVHDKDLKKLNDIISEGSIISSRWNNCGDQKNKILTSLTINFVSADKLPSINQINIKIFNDMRIILY